MHATTPPRENQLATRTAVIVAARARLAPLFPNPADLDELPAWLWSVPADAIARALVFDAPDMAHELARRIEVETAKRHPAEAYVAHLAARHPLLSNVQRARLAEFTHHVAELRHDLLREPKAADLARFGFTAHECERLAPRAAELITAIRDGAQAEHSATDRAPADRLRTAGELAHTRRAFAEGDLEIRPSTKALPSVTGAAA